ncbi:VOC family protein [Conservatibacter flavescens]|uniref:Metalloprotein n=1 Tax=Conservatibacter flavescens TaxID=28161 RepID=A0A2M8S5F2_9PAST|nr:VOC family protein [Conservatibacter flavescens]PJG86382.1 metalloprotein [Conservatibacter flavescens]
MQNLNKNHKLFETNPALLQDFIVFEQKIAQLATAMKLSLADYEIDHLALRVNSVVSAEQWTTLLGKCGHVLSQNVINGRPIYLFELEEPLVFFEQQVRIIELPYPKNKIYPKESWEHIEVVMPFLFKESTVEWMDRIKSTYSWNHLNQLKVKVSEPKAEGEQLPNPSIAVSLMDPQNHCTIKVHPYSIKKIIEVLS